MHKFKLKLLMTILLMTVSFFTCSTGMLTYAEETQTETDPASQETFYFEENVQKAKDDTGFVELSPVSSDDIHYGWSLGRFVITGFTRETTDEETGLPVFLKNAGDEVTLSFQLEQDINALNGNEKLTINDDTGYDEYFGIEETHFGKGALIIAETDYQNHHSKPTLHTDYLLGIERGGDKVVQLCEEGDYEVALDYSILQRTFNDLGAIPTSKIGESENDYCFYFSFSVRNGDCMVYPMDAKTGSELTNQAFTPNGFRLDLAKSRYLDIDISKKVLSAGKDDLVEDTRFNRPARDGEEFTEEGIYCIKVTNRYTNSTTEKQLYVGTNAVLQAYVTNPTYSVQEITNLVQEGATIQSDGSIKMPETTTTTTTTTITTTTTTMTTTTATASATPQNETTETTTEENTGKFNVLIVIVPVAIIVIMLVLCVKKKQPKRKKRKRKHRNPGDFL